MANVFDRLKKVLGGDSNKDDLAECSFIIKEMFDNDSSDFTVSDSSYNVIKTPEKQGGAFKVKFNSGLISELKKMRETIFNGVNDLTLYLSKTKLNKKNIENVRLKVERLRITFSSYLIKDGRVYIYIDGVIPDVRVLGHIGVLKKSIDELTSEIRALFENALKVGDFSDEFAIGLNQKCVELSKLIAKKEKYVYPLYKKVG